ncbi:MAG: DUF4350 domain-containing protein [Gammaproteobacteria bacterium]|nr:MAG: DUF4350 domain-containing protein [Gammaproteobacteria bacterium]
MTRRTIYLLLGGLLLILVVWIMAHLRPVIVTVPVPPGEEAVRWPLLALERFVERMGGSSARLTDPRALRQHPAPDETLIILEDGPLIAPQAPELLARVREGGRLIIGLPRSEAENLQGARLPIFEALQLGGQARDKCSGQKTLDTALTDDNGTPLQLKMDACRWIISLGGAPGAPARNTVAKLLGMRGEVLARDKDGVHLLRRRLGKGEIILASDLAWLEGTRPGEANHAELIWRLVGDRPRVLLMARPDAPPLYRLILDHLPQTSAVLALLLLAWLWRRTVRFGPLLPPPSGERRSLGEHIEAAGRYLWEQHAEQGLLESVRRRVLRTLARHHPQSRHLDDNARILWLAERVDMPPETVHRLLHGSPPHQRHEFTRIIQQLQRLEEQIRT